MLIHAVAPANTTNSHCKLIEQGSCPFSQTIIPIVMFFQCPNKYFSVGSQAVAKKDISSSHARRTWLAAEVELRFCWSRFRFQILREFSPILRISRREDRIVLYNLKTLGYIQVNHFFGRTRYMPWDMKKSPISGSPVILRHYRRKEGKGLC